jgi:AcrR family transcriptional regulator
VAQSNQPGPGPASAAGGIEPGTRIGAVETGGWERRKVQTRVALAEAAVRLFSEHGYEATTVEDIARAAHSSPRTFFRYFGTKEDVLFLNMAEIQDRFRDFLRERIPGLTCWEQIHLGINMAIRQVAEPSPEVREYSIRSWLAEPAVSGRFHKLVDQMEKNMANALAAERGVDADHDLHVQLAARAATAIYTTAFHLHVHTGKDLCHLVDQGFAVAAKSFADWPSAARGA